MRCHVADAARQSPDDRNSCLDPVTWIARGRGRLVAGRLSPTPSRPRWHGSLEGVGGLKTNEAYHSKADALVIPEMFFYLPTPFFWKCWFCKIRHLFRCACRILQNQHFQKGRRKIFKKLHFWNQQGVSFRVVCFVCFEPSDPFQRTVWVPMGRGGRPTRASPRGSAGG